MKYPPSRYRLIHENLSISAPLKDAGIKFLHDSGCRKILTLPGGFVSSDVVVALKKRKMEVEHFPVEIHLPETLYSEQFERVLNKIVQVLKRGSRLHVVCGPEMIEAACITGLLRQVYQEWNSSSAISEALDICRFADAESVVDIVTNCVNNFRD